MRPPTPDPDGRRRARNSRGQSKPGPAGLAIAALAGAALVVAGQALYSWFNTEPPQENEGEKAYYRLPPDAATKEEAQASPSTTSAGVAPSDSAVGGGNRCVCCMERPQSFMFVECRHLCLCEPCVIQLSLSSKAAAQSDVRSGQKPVSVPCPMCRHVGPLMKTYAGCAPFGNGCGTLAGSVRVPLAFAAAHPAARLATEASAPGYRAYGVLVWHRPLCAPPGGYRLARLWRPYRSEHAPTHGIASSRSTSASSTSSLSTNTETSNANKEAASPPPPLPGVSSAAASAPAARAGATRGTNAITPAASAIPRESKVVVVLHGFDASEPEAGDGTPRLWSVLRPLQWWLNICVQPAAQRPPPQQQQQHQQQYACGLRLFVSASALPHHRPQFRVPASLQPSATAAGAATQPTTPPVWAAGAVLELQLCGPVNESALLFASHDVLRAVRQRGSGVCAFGSFTTPFVSQGASSLAALSSPATRTPNSTAARRGYLELLRPEDVWALPVNNGSGGDAGTELPPSHRVPVALSPPLPPLHTLDLSFRIDLTDLEESLVAWAAAGLLRCLRRLSVMGCRQLSHLRWVAALPCDELEVLNLSGCDALRDLRALRRLRSLRHLKAAQLPHLSRLGWWDEEADGVVGTGTALEWPAQMEELDLRCTQRRTRPIDDFACLSLLHRLRQLAITVPVAPRTGTHATPASRVGRGAAHFDNSHDRLPPLHPSGNSDPRELVSAALQRRPFALEWLTGCAELRDLRLAFRCGCNDDGRAVVPVGPAIVAQLTASLAMSPVCVVALTRLARPSSVAGGGGGGGQARHVTAAQWSPPMGSSAAASASDAAAETSALGFLCLHPFPLLEKVELTSAVLADTFTSSIATGCPRLREVRLHDCLVRCSAAGLHAAQTAAAPAAATAAAAAAETAPLPAPRRGSAEWDAAHRASDEQWWWGQLGRLRRLRLLCVIGAEGLLDGASLDWIAACTALRHLIVRQCRWLLDAYAVHRLPRLRTLNLSNTGIDDLTFLRMRHGAVVAGARVGAAPPLTSASAGAAAAAPSALLRLRSPFRRTAPTMPTVLAPLLPRGARAHALAAVPTATLSHLTELVLIDCPFAQDLTPLSCLTACRRLFASDHHHVTSLGHLAGCTAMEELYLIHYAKLADTSALRRLRRLRVLYITHSSVRDWSWVAQSLQATACPTRRTSQARLRRGRRSSSGGGSPSHARARCRARSATAGAVGMDHRDTQSDGNEDDGTDSDDEADKRGVLPRLEVLTLTDSRLLTDARPLGALPRLRQLYLTDCIALTTLGEADAHLPDPAHHTDTASERGENDCGDVVSAVADKGRAGPRAAAWPAPPPLSYWAAAHAAAARLARVSQTVRGQLANVVTRLARVWRSSGATDWFADDAVQGADAAGVGRRGVGAAASAVSAEAASALPSTAASWSLAHLRGTLRYLSLAGCSALKDGRAVGSLTQLEYLHAPSTGLRDVRWIAGCRSLQVIDLSNAPCCVGEAKVALEAVLPQRLPRLELLNNCPVGETL